MLQKTSVSFVCSIAFVTANTINALNTTNSLKPDADFNVSVCRIVDRIHTVIPLVVELRRKKLSIVLLTFFNGGRGHLDIINDLSIIVSRYVTKPTIR